MKTPPPDPILNAINDGIRRSINVVIENQCFGATIILIFAAIDAMSHINRPPGEKYNDSDDFKIWVGKYFHVFGQTKVTRDEWWAARNAILHTYGAYSKLHEQPGIRQIGWITNSKAHILYEPSVAPQLVMVDILAMRDAFFKGMDSFLIEVFADPTRKELMEQRINELIMTFPGKKGL